MRFDVSSYGSLKGVAELPGDRSLTLTLLVCAALSGERLAILNPSPSPDVKSLWAWLSSNGIIVINDGGRLLVDGGSFTDTLDLKSNVHDDILHILVSGAVFSGRSVVIHDITDRRKDSIETLSRVLEKIGLPKNAFSVEDEQIRFDAASFSTENVIQVDTIWAAECVMAASLVSKQDIRLSAPGPVLTHVGTVMGLFGYQQLNKNEDGSRENEIARRMAKAQGKPLPDVRCYTRTDAVIHEITVPGDTAFAAALVSAASILQKSSLTIRSVLWSQSRRGFFETIRRMKGHIEYESYKRKNAFDTADISISWGALEAVHVTADQARSLQTELLILGATGACATGETVISDTLSADCPGLGRERFMALSFGLEILGAHVGDYADGIVVKGQAELRGNLIDACNDPDLALAFYLLGMCSAGTTSIFGYDEERYPVATFKNILESLHENASPKFI